MVDMPDYAHPYAPNLTSNANALTQLQSFFNLNAKQNVMAQAGQQAATGDFTGAMNTQYRGGYMDEADAMYKHMKSVNADEAKESADTYKLFANAVKASQNSDGTTDMQKYGHLMDYLKAQGQDTSKFLGPDGPQRALIMADQVEAYHKQILEEREQTLKSELLKAQIQKAQKETEASKFAQVGESPLSGKQYGFPNAKTGTVTLPRFVGPNGEEMEPSPGGGFRPASPSTTPAALPPAAAQPAAAASMPAASGATSISASLPVPGTKGGEAVPVAEKLNESALEGLSPEQAEQIKAWNEGREKIPDTVRPHSLVEALLLRLHSYNPNLHKADLNAAFKFRDQFMSANQKRQNEGISFNTATNHAGNAIESSDWLPSGSKLSTSPQMLWAELKNDPRLAAVISDRNVLAGEAAKVIHGGESVETEKAFKDLMDPAKGKEAYQAGVAHVMQAMADKSGEIEQQWSRNMRHYGNPSLPSEIEVMSPTAKARLEEMKGALTKAGNRGLPKSWAGAKSAKEKSDDELRQSLGLK